MASSDKGHRAPARQRLPTLAECLKRNTRPPVDLYCYYLFLQREGAEDMLDFWLDVQQHENLCRAYFGDLLKGQHVSLGTDESARVVQEDWPLYAHYAKTRGSIYNKFTGIQQDYNFTLDPDSPGTAGFDGRGSRTARNSDEESAEAMLAQDGSAGHESLSGGGEKGWRDGQRRGYEEPLDGLEGEGGVDGYAPPPSGDGGEFEAYPQSNTLRALYPHDPGSPSLAPPSPPLGSVSRRPLSPFSRVPVPTAQPYIHRSTALSRTDLISSAERIYSRYLMPNSQKEIYLPSSLRIPSFPIVSSTLPAPSSAAYLPQATAQAAVPDMFHAQKEWVYENLRGGSWPRFLRDKAFGNLVGISRVVRGGVGLLALWVGLATGFAFIFLDTKPRETRLWIILPLTVAIFNLMAYLYSLDVILVFMGLSETTPFRTIGIKEPYVRKLLFIRAIYVTLFSSTFIAALVVLFYEVPGYRL